MSCLFNFRNQMRFNPPSPKCFACLVGSVCDFFVFPFQLPQPGAFQTSSQSANLPFRPRKAESPCNLCGHAGAVGTCLDIRELQAQSTLDMRVQICTQTF